MSADSLQRQHLSKGLSAGMQRTLSLLYSERARTIAKVSVINANGRAPPADVCFTVKIFGFDGLNPPAVVNFEENSRRFDYSCE